MPHPLVDQLHFARSEFARCFDGVTPEDAVRRVQPMNSLSWIVCHLALQESGFWVLLVQGEELRLDLREQLGNRQTPGTPPLDEMWAAWREITAAADRYLDTLTPSMLVTRLVFKGEPVPESVGTLLYRNIYHYWFHTGEAHGIRQALGHTGLADFVGALGDQAPYRPEQP
jgi:hypothetical protein